MDPPQTKKGFSDNSPNLNKNKRDSCNDFNNRNYQYNNKPTFTGEQAWRNTKPSSGNPKTKTIKGSTWHSCEHHQAWVRHPTEKCFKGKITSNSHIIQPIMNNLSNMQASMVLISIKDIVDDESEKI
jgi:heme-degrading monooxygenase HmoA